MQRSYRDAEMWSLPKGCHKELWDSVCILLEMTQILCSEDLLVALQDVLQFFE